VTAPWRAWRCVLARLLVLSLLGVIAAAVEVGGVLWEVEAGKNDATAAQAAKSEIDALNLFKGDMGAFLRLYTFLSQIFDYGNAAIEKRAIFYKHLLPLLELGREREGIDLSKVKLTHHTLKSHGKAAMSLGGGERPKLPPITEAGSGGVQERERARLDEIIEKVNTLFKGELTDQDKLVYVNDVIKGKLLESKMLAQQAANNTKEQFANSPDLKTEMLNAIMEALDAHTLMSTQALSSEAVQDGIKDVLLNHAKLWESLRERAAGVASGA
jgi:type I restriction enzyme, R subunit